MLASFPDYIVLLSKAAVFVAVLADIYIAALETSGVLGCECLTTFLRNSSLQSKSVDMARIASVAIASEVTVDNYL